ncbi:hypothetical protein OPIT5_17860 [Opitutaceae bacterium TAV5]|nr:hypothetical protein OPIT5_17860 [Opitutaceae bacterium TAV5]
MTVDYTIIVLSIILLWIPRSWMKIGRLSRHRGGSGVRSGSRGKEKSLARARLLVDYRLDRRKAFGDLRNWLDMFRALAGSVGLFVMGVQGLTDMPLDIATPWIAGQIGVVMVAVYIQTFRFGKDFVFFAPVFFIQGLMFGLTNGWMVLPILIGLWTVLAHPAAFLAAFGGIVAIFGALTGVPTVYVLAALGVTMGPVLTSILARQKMAASITRCLIREAPVRSLPGMNRRLAPVAEHETPARHDR